MSANSSVEANLFATNAYNALVSLSLLMSLSTTVRGLTRISKGAELRIKSSFPVDLKISTEALQRPTFVVICPPKVKYQLSPSFCNSVKQTVESFFFTFNITLYPEGTVYKDVLFINVTIILIELLSD